MLIVFLVTASLAAICFAVIINCKLDSKHQDEITQAEVNYKTETFSDFTPPESKSYLFENYYLSINP